MYAAAGGASIASRKARNTRPPSERPPSPHGPHAVRAYSCLHWESRLALPPPPQPPQPPQQPSPSSPHHDLSLSECAAGRAAWQEAAAGGAGAAGGAPRRCSVPGDRPRPRNAFQQATQKAWSRNNRVRDASYGSSSDSEGDWEAESNDSWGVARLLYAGLATLAVGLVVYFVGTGEKGFRTPALRLVGPSLIIAGLACCVLRILLCICAKPCCRRSLQTKDRRLSIGVEGEEMPLQCGERLGPAQCSPARRLDTSSCDVSSLSSGEEDERLRRYRTASAPLPTPVTTIVVSHSAKTLPPLSPDSIPSGSKLSPTNAFFDKPQPDAYASSCEQSSVPEAKPFPTVSNVSSKVLPPPRNVSFASNTGELLLSPSQLPS